MCVYIDGENSVQHTQINVQSTPEREVVDLRIVLKPSQPQPQPQPQPQHQHQP